MLNKVFRITLTAIVLTFFVCYPFLYATESGSTDHGPHDKLDQAKRQEYNARELADREFNTLQTVNRIVGDLALGYSAKSAAIAKGKSVTIAAAIGAIGSAVATGGVTIPTVAGLIGAAKSLHLSWNGSDNFLHRYDEALKLKIAQVTKTKAAIKAYNDVYWNKYYKERSNHLNSVTTHKAIHHSPVRTQWKRTPDYSLPSFRCRGDCRQTFNSPLGEHGEVCGAKKRDNNSVPPGCFDVWYSCVEKDVKKHKPIECTLPYKIYRKVEGKKKELRITQSCPDKFRRCVAFDLGYHEAVYHMYVDANGNLRFVEPYGQRKVTYGEQVKHQHKPKKRRESDDADDDENADAGDDSSAMHVCGIHATTVSGNHSRITPPCGDSAHATFACQISSDHKTKLSGWSGTFYKCQPHTTFPCGHTDPTANSVYHAYGTFPCGISTHLGHVCTAAAASDALNHTRQASCSVTNANGDRCTVTNFYACQPHTHVYPTPTISCGHSACSQKVSSSTEHSATCANGHAYWSCNPSAVRHHITRKCRFSKCGRTWQKCATGGTTPLCNNPWRKKNGLRCWEIYAARLNN